ncbi:MAG TPA: hypothetical protein VLT79_02545 [Gemmatimonadales bacterium]|nr:hypothetical protein [Gemmatimonadales bacterium]
MKRALQAILGVSSFGLVFSGVLTYHELFGQAALTCPAPGAPGTVFGYPACVYGFFMYLLITAIAISGLVTPKRADRARGTTVPDAHAH